MRSSARRLVLAAAPLAVLGAILVTAGPSAGTTPPARVLAADAVTDAVTESSTEPSTDTTVAPTPPAPPTASTASTDGFSWG
ncbi:hypothetical protein [Streptomyces sp. NPDC093795]|uniref:hypothetical protein n=1 Tax=Streptomyces sp. NPDC093795 TaxID=3366051 RepID=UPI0037FE6A01